MPSPEVLRKRKYGVLGKKKRGSSMPYRHVKGHDEGYENSHFVLEEGASAGDRERSQKPQ